MSVRLPQIASAQCKRARALLKWNPQDLAAHSRIPVKRIELFEQNRTRLERPENDAVVRLFLQYHIDFRPDGTVHFRASATHKTSASEMTTYDADLVPSAMSQGTEATRDEWGGSSAAPRNATEVSPTKPPLHST